MDNLTDRGELPEGVTEIRVARGRNYKLVGSFAGTPTGLAEPPTNGGTGWRLLKGFVVRGRDGPGIEISLEGCFVGQESYHARFLEGGALQRSLEGTFLVKRVHRVVLQTERPPSAITDWYLNGPSKEMFFPGGTKRKITVAYERERLGIDKGNKRLTSPTEQSSRDFLHITYGERGFIVHRVPEGLGPSWSNSLGIEYSEDFGGIPDSDGRRKIGEFLSFLFGRQLLQVGSTELLSDGSTHEEEATNPWGNYVEVACSEPAVPPIDIGNPEGGQRLERTASALLPAYLKKRDPLNLDVALWLYWIGSSMPLGTDLPVYYSGLSAVVNARFRSTEDAPPATYMPKDEFDTLLGGVLEEARKRLASHPDGSRILENLGRAYQRSINQRFAYFFQELELPIGTVEDRALKERHRWAHGGTTDVDVEEAYQYRRVYWTLLSRVILRILGYEGGYLDLSGRKEAVRPLNNPAGGE